jgi:hypothetical protein
MFCEILTFPRRLHCIKTWINERVVCVNCQIFTLQFQLGFRYGSVFDNFQIAISDCRDMAAITAYFLYVTSGIWRFEFRYTCSDVLEEPNIPFSGWKINMSAEHSFKISLYQSLYWLCYPGYLLCLPESLWYVTLLLLIKLYTKQAHYSTRQINETLSSISLSQKLQLRRRLFCYIHVSEFQKNAQGKGVLVKRIPHFNMCHFVDNRNNNLRKS